MIKAFIKQLMEHKESQRLETLVGLRVALNSWAAMPKNKVTENGESIIGAKKVKVTGNFGWELSVEEGCLSLRFNRRHCPCDVPSKVE